MKTYLPKQEEVEKRWLIFDAKDQILGRLAVKIADALRGKDLPTYTPHMDLGAHVIVINSDEVAFTGKKEKEKVYLTYSGYMGGQKSYTAEEIRKKDSTRLIRLAVKGMVPNNRLGRKILTNLHVYPTAEHKHEAQQAEIVKL